MNDENLIEESTEECKEESTEEYTEECTEESTEESNEESNQIITEINVINDIDFDSSLDNLGFLGISLFVIIFFLGVSFILRED